MSKSRIPQQLIPLAVIFLLLIASLVVARQIFVPKTFGRYGHYRATAVDDVAKRDMVYAGYRKCLDCHDDIYQAKQQSSHAGLACETCHGAAAKHANAPDESLPTVPRGRQFCLLCHNYNPARPQGFPQILADMHNTGKPCTACHNSHAPRLTTAPGECSACHREIANQKAVSNHALLQCTDCHTVPAEHFNQPRMVRALKPTGKETCGRCHAKDAASGPEVARIDMNDHGGRYLCWDCHYPHLPETSHEQ